MEARTAHGAILRDAHLRRAPQSTCPMRAEASGLGACDTRGAPDGPAPRLKDGRPLMNEHNLYVGLDTGKNPIDVAVAEPLRGGEVRYWGKIVNEAAALDRVVKRLQQGGRRLQVCYEAGPCGYGIYRRLNAKPQVSCAVVAPSLTPRRPGVRMKTNRRDCLTLVNLLGAEELT